MRISDRCISASDLLKGHALSYTDQPYFRQLIEVARDPKRPLVVIAGAGVSMAAGLPSWPELVARLETQVVPKHLSNAFNILNAENLERRTDTVLFLTGDNGVNSKNVKYLREALYGDTTEPDPSMVAQSIAHLAAVYPQRISILTTNFDEVLETALEEVFGASPRSHSFDSWNEWNNLEDDEHKKSVMHIHGLIYSDDRASLSPLVLSESDFRQYGVGIQTSLVALMEDSDVLVLGASLADRNVATPLALTRQAGTERHVVVTPPLVHQELSDEECAEVAVWQADALKQSLGVKPILLKCYAQIAQLVTEFVLAAHSPSHYRRSQAGLRVSESLHYGTRLKFGLQGIYKALGSTKRDGSLSDWEALALSNRLHELTFSRDGPNARLQKLRQRHKGECAAEENIGVFLWLRAPNYSAADSSFSLRLVVTSAYAHWKSWSGYRLEPIRADSNSAAVQAAFTGRAVFVDVPRASHSGAWQGAWAEPLLAGYTTSNADISDFPLDHLQLGAVAVNTDRKVTMSSPQDAEDLSALAVLTAEEMDFFRESLDRVVEELVT